MVPVLVLLFVALCFVLRGGLFCAVPFSYFVLVFFGPFCVAGGWGGGGGRAGIGAFRTFVLFVLVWFCRFSLPLSVWERLRFVIVEFPGLFSYPFLTICL